MIDLVKSTPCEGLVPVTAGPMRLTEVTPRHMTALAVYRGQKAALGQALDRAHDLRWPAPGEVIAAKGAEIRWFGRDMALLVGPVPGADLAKHAALTDQSDAWAVLRLEGAGAKEVMARIVPLDLREAAFGVGRTARTDVAHMSGAVTRKGTEAYELMVFRSMAHSLVHELELAMRRVAARSAAG